MRRPGGGAHPTEAFPITPGFEITVPVARSVNPVTGGNWEGTGVEPDIATPAAEAFDLAYREALQHVLTTSTKEGQPAFAGHPRRSPRGAGQVMMCAAATGGRWRPRTYRVSRRGRQPR